MHKGRNISYNRIAYTIRSRGVSIEPKNVMFHMQLSASFAFLLSISVWTLSGHSPLCLKNQN